MADEPRVHVTLPPMGTLEALRLSVDLSCLALEEATRAAKLAVEGKDGSRHSERGRALSDLARTVGEAAGGVLRGGTTSGKVVPLEALPTDVCSAEGEE